MKTTTTMMMIAFSTFTVGCAQAVVDGDEAAMDESTASEIRLSESEVEQVISDVEKQYGFTPVETKEDEGNQVATIYDCGPEPICQNGGSGIAACMAEAACRRELCAWAACQNQNECIQNGGYSWLCKSQMAGAALACGGVHSIEVTGCLRRAAL